MARFPFSIVGNLTVEGKILHKFDMKPHDDNIESYGKLCRERTKQSMTRTRQIKVFPYHFENHVLLYTNDSD